MDKISVVMVSGSLERLQAAAMVASVAAVSGHEVLVFLSITLSSLPAHRHTRIPSLPV